MKNVEVAKKLFAWNQKNLIASAEINKAELSHYFANSFQVQANGRHYDANYDNYLEFLNQFRATIQSIHYEFEDPIVDGNQVVMPLSAQVTRTNDTIDNFVAMLLLRFDQAHKITLWHEVYVKI
jgi:predicted ester cyclase